MDKNISSNSINDSFSLIIDTIVEEKSKKIDKKHYAEGFDLLGAEIFPQNKIPFSENEIKKIGPDFIAEWIVKNWSSLNEERRILFFGKLIEQLQGNPKCCRSFNVLLCSKLIGLFAEDAVRLLGKICQQTKISTSFPLNKELCLKVRTFFLNPKNILIEQVPLSSGIPGVEDVAKYGICAAFVESKNGKTAGEIAQIQVLKWITESGISLVVPDEIAELIRKSELINDRNISKIQEFLPTFPIEIKWEQQSKQVIPPDERGEDATIQLEVEKLEQFDPIYSLKQLAKYIQQTQNTTKKSQEEINRLEKNHNILLNDKIALKEKQKNLNKKITALRNELDGKNSVIDKLETDLAAIQQNSSNLKREKENLLSQLEKEKAHYQEELNRFSRTIEASSNHKKEVILNRIRESLRTEFRNLTKIEDMEMTVQTGETIRSLLKRIFSKLKLEGINFTEGN